MIFKIFFILLALESISYVSSSAIENFLRPDEELFYRGLMEPFNILTLKLYGRMSDDMINYQWKIIAADESCNELYKEWKTTYDKVIKMDLLTYPELFHRFCVPIKPKIEQCQQKILNYIETLTKDTSVRTNPFIKIRFIYRSLNSACLFGRKDIEEQYLNEHKSCFSNVEKSPGACYGSFLNVDTFIIVPADSTEDKLKSACSAYYDKINCIIETYEQCNSQDLLDYYLEYSPAGVKAICEVEDPVDYAFKRIDDEDYLLA